MMQDPLADMLTRIRNGLMVRKACVIARDSKLNREVLRVLQEEGYLDGFAAKDMEGKPALEIRLRYHVGEPAIFRIQRTSSPSLRVYRGSASLPRVMNGLGLAVVSTSLGVMSDRKARSLKVGGEVLCEVF